MSKLEQIERVLLERPDIVHVDKQIHVYGLRSGTVGHGTVTIPFSVLLEVSVKGELSDVDHEEAMKWALTAFKASCSMAGPPVVLLVQGKTYSLTYTDKEGRMYIVDLTGSTKEIKRGVTEERGDVLYTFRKIWPTKEAILEKHIQKMNYGEFESFMEKILNRTKEFYDTVVITPFSIQGIEGELITQYLNLWLRENPIHGNKTIKVARLSSVSWLWLQQWAGRQPDLIVNRWEETTGFVRDIGNSSRSIEVQHLEIRLAADNTVIHRRSR